MATVSPDANRRIRQAHLFSPRCKSAFSAKRNYKRFLMPQAVTGEPVQFPGQFLKSAWRAKFDATETKNEEMLGNAGIVNADSNQAMSKRRVLSPAWQVQAGRGSVILNLIADQRRAGDGRTSATPCRLTAAEYLPSAMPVFFWHHRSRRMPF